MGVMQLMKSKMVGASAAIAIFMLHGCAASPAPRIDHDATHDFSNYQSFTWVSENPMRVGETAGPPSGTLQSDIMAAIQSRLEANNFHLVDTPELADFLVSFSIGSRESVKPDSDTEKLTGSGGRGGWGTAVYGGDSDSYMQGILVIDIIDAAEGQSVWRGASSKKITADDRENMAEVINAVVDTILSDYPPR